MPTTEGPISPGFWRCDRCGTPNPATLYITSCIGCGARRLPPGFASRADAAVAAPGPARAPRSRALLVAVASYGALLIAAWLLERVIGDAWWPGMALYMAPRALFLLPLLGLAIWSWRGRRKLIGGVVLVEALFVAGPIMGFAVPWSRLVARPEGPRVRIMTFNRSGGPIEAARFVAYLERQAIDVVCFQEEHPDAVLDRLFEQRGWHYVQGKAIATRLPIVAELPRSLEVNEKDPRYAGMLYTAILYRARLRGPDGREFLVGSLHMPTARYAFRQLLELHPAAMTSYIAWWNSEFERMFALLNDAGDLPVLLGGDFNNAPEASLLAALRDSGMYRSAFEEAGLGWGYTRPSAWPWVRIDHILASSNCVVTSCRVGPDFGSDHRSLVAEVGAAVKTVTSGRREGPGTGIRVAAGVRLA